MIKILFVCHGNICRSPMAEFFMKDLAENRGLSGRFHVESAAVSTEEIPGGVGNPVYPPAREELQRHGISCDGKRARLMTREDYDRFNILIGMDGGNVNRMEAIAGGDPKNKIHRLLDVSGDCRDMADPWYTGDFQTTWNDISAGCTALADLLTFDGELVLASASPRRRELLHHVGIRTVVDPSDGEEWSQESDPGRYVEELARCKVFDVADRHGDQWVLGSDTVVTLDGNIMGKPADEEEAVRMLRELSGRTHKVFTGVSILRMDRGRVLYEKTFSRSTDVTFYKLSDELIDRYVSSGEPFDKAGAYGIQGRGAVLVKEIRGDYNTVVGLPLAEVYRALEY